VAGAAAATLAPAPAAVPVAVAASRLKIGADGSRGSFGSSDAGAISAAAVMRVRREIRFCMRVLRSSAIRSPRLRRGAEGRARSRAAPRCDVSTLSGTR
jgi:hypothetical protein